MALLQDILYKVGIRSLTGRTDLQIADLQIDSKRVGNGSCFIAVKGGSLDGHAYIQTAIANGAIAVVCSDLPAEINEGVTYVQTADSATAAGIMAHAFYGEPST